MAGETGKTRKRKENKRKESVLSPTKQKANVLSSSDFTTATQSPGESPVKTPRRSSRKTCLTSTPLAVTSADLLSSVSPGITQVEHESCNCIPELKVDSQASQVKSQSRCRKVNASQKSRVKRRVTRKPMQPCSETNSPPAKRQHGRQKTEPRNLKSCIVTQSSRQNRPRFELGEPESPELDDSLLSSDLSIELSHYEERMPSLSLRDEEESEEEEEEDEELPSFLVQVDKKPPPITTGAFVWHKFRHYPYWPALVKTVYPKQKKASIVFIDYPIFEKKGFVVALKSLKPFDYEEASERMREAKEQYDAAISWASELITDYRIRIACGSFSGSFLKYFAHDMSYPVRRKYPQDTSKRLNIASEAIALDDTCDVLKEDSLNEQHEDASRGSKRLLPDRTHAAHNRANEKLVHFIVKQRMVERHLLAVICGEQDSRWLRSFMSAKQRRVVNIYLEDDQQLDQVYCYLSELYTSAVATASCLAEVKSTECVPFVLDVLLPEAIIYAIAGVDNVSVQQAEEKYLKGRCLSQREKQEFELMIDKHIKHMKIETWHQSTPAFPNCMV